MSKRVDLSRALSDVDKEYLVGVGRYADVQLNERRYAVQTTEPVVPVVVPESPEPVVASKKQLDPEDIEWVNSLKVEELKDALGTREKDVNGTKQELRDRLTQAMLGELSWPN